MSRWKAALIHCSISAVVALVTFSLLFGVWYPPPLFEAAGAERLMLLVVGIDLCLGPLCTLVVFKSGKKGLKFDLVVIGVVQSAALVYGLAVMLESRPVFMVAAVDRVELVAANEISDADLAAAPAPYRHRSWTGPVLVGTQPPTDSHEKSDLLWASVTTGKDIENLPKYYVPWAQSAPALLQRARPMSELVAMHPQARAKLEGWLAKREHNDQQALWVPLVARDHDLVMILDAQTGDPLGSVALDPWAPSPPAQTP